MNKIKFKVKTDKFGDFLKKLEDLTKIPDIGPVMAKNAITFFNNKKNQAIISL